MPNIHSNISFALVNIPVFLNPIIKNNDLKPDWDKEIEVISFIKEGSVPPWYFEKSYFLNTEGKSKAYNLFYEALKKTKRVALVKTVIGPKFYYGILKLVENGINNFIF